MKVLGNLIVVLVVLGSLALVYVFNQRTTKAGAELTQERYSRMVAEEGLSKARQDIEKLQKDLEKSVAKVNSLENLLEQTNAVNEDLKNRLQKVAQIKDNLEAKINELNSMGAAAGGGL